MSIDDASNLREHVAAVVDGGRDGMEAGFGGGGLVAAAVVEEDDLVAHFLRSLVLLLGFCCS